MTNLPDSAIGVADPELVLFNKGGRAHRLTQLQQGQPVPREFFYGFFELSRQRRIAMLSTADAYPGRQGWIMNAVEQAWSRTTHLGLRLWHVGRLQPLLRCARTLISFTDGYSLTLGLYYRDRSRPSRPFVIGGFNGLSDLEDRGALLRPVARWLVGKSLRGLDHIFFLGAPDRDEALVRYGLDPTRTSVCRFGVDTEFWTPAPAEQPEPVFIAVGQDRNRDYDLLTRVPTAHRITILTRNKVSVPPERTNVTVTSGGYSDSAALTDEQLRDLYRCATAVVVPLRDVYQPSGCSVTLQAMACGRPVVLTRTRGLWAPDLLRHGENCLLVPPGDAAALAAAFDQLARDPALQRRLGENARMTAEQHFGLATLIQDVTALAALGDR